MVKVCHLTSAHERYDGRIFDRDCKTLSKNGYEVSLIVNDKYFDEIKDGVTIISTKYEAKNRIDRMVNSTKAIYKEALKVDADLYHLHDPELLPLAHKLKKKGKIVIFDSHECYYLQIKNKNYIPKIIRSFIANIYKLYETKICREIDAVIIPCSLQGKNFFEGRAKYVEFINNVPNYETEKTYHRQNIEASVCYAGTLSRSRGIVQLIKACYQSGIKLVLAGEITDNSLQDELKNMKETSIIDFKGKLTKEEVFNMYSQCSIGACTLLDVGQYYKADNLSTKVYEYMLMAMPVILSDSSYNKKVIDEYKFGVVVNPNDVNDISQKINYLVNNKQIADKMGNNGLKAVNNVFNWNVESQKLIKLYKVLLNG